MRSNLAQKDNDFEEKVHGIHGASLGWKSMARKGRGVFARRDFKKGDVIEVAPVVPVAEENVPEDEFPDGYLLAWDEDTPGEEYAMALGYIMLYNHSAKPNMDLECDFEDETISAVASRRIKAGEELTWDYGCDLWFETEE